MNNFYCFNCQKEVEPKSIFGIRFCPICGKRITDSGEGFYLVCDNCGANNPINAEKCIKCNNRFNNITNIDENVYPTNKTLTSLILDFLFVIGGIAFSVLILYISFYLVFVFFVIGVIYFLFSKVRTRF